LKICSRYSIAHRPELLPHTFRPSFFPPTTWTNLWRLHKVARSSIDEGSASQICGQRCRIDETGPTMDAVIRLVILQFFYATYILPDMLWTCGFSADTRARHNKIMRVRCKCFHEVLKTLASDDVYVFWIFSMILLRLMGFLQLVVICCIPFFLYELWCF
jgi:hypothetical protein